METGLCVLSVLLLASARLKHDGSILTHDERGPADYVLFVAIRSNASIA